MTQRFRLKKAKSYTYITIIYVKYIWEFFENFYMLESY